MINKANASLSSPETGLRGRQSARAEKTTVSGIPQSIDDATRRCSRGPQLPDRTLWIVSQLPPPIDKRVNPFKLGRYPTAYVHNLTGKANAAPPPPETILLDCHSALLELVEHGISSLRAPTTQFAGALEDQDTPQDTLDGVAARRLDNGLASATMIWSGKRRNLAAAADRPARPPECACAPTACRSHRASTKRLGAALEGRGYHAGHSGRRRSASSQKWIGTDDNTIDQ